MYNSLYINASLVQEADIFIFRGGIPDVPETIYVFGGFCFFRCFCVFSCTNCPEPLRAVCCYREERNPSRRYRTACCMEYVCTLHYRGYNRRTLRNTCNFRYIHHQICNVASIISYCFISPHSHLMIAL